MLNRLFILITTFILSVNSYCLFAECGLGGYQSDIVQDLMTVERIDCCLNDRLPLYLNHLLQGGYFNMPSARMGKEGECSAGYSSVYPYDNYNLRLQLLDRVEISGNYRVFRGQEDANLSKWGFGDFSDKGANVKFGLLLPEDTQYLLPGIAFGFEDFIGTKAFEANYLVFTQVIPSWNFEMSLGFGSMRIRDLFGGFTWIPFRNSCNAYIKNIAFVAEYDAIPYKSKKREPHEKAHSKKSPINYGLKYRFWDLIDLSVCHFKGEKVACAISSTLNFGYAKNWLPKIDQSLPYKAPINTEPLGPLRPTDVFVSDLTHSFCDQGFSLQEAWLTEDLCGAKTLRLKILNCAYRYEKDVRDRLNALLSCLIPGNIDNVIVTVSEEGFQIQEYHFRMEFVRMYAKHQACLYELYVLSPLKEASKVPYNCSERLFKGAGNLWNFSLAPKTHSLFGSAKGKYKYALGVEAILNGYVFSDWYYSLILGYTAISDLYDLSDIDTLNPSQIVNVRTDIINYLKQDGLTLDEAYIEKVWNGSNGCFYRFAVGIFEVEYGGIATEFLYYPVNSNWAVGIESAYLLKRTYDSFGFTDQVRKLHHKTPSYHKFDFAQYFANFYCNLDFMDLNVHLKAGKFVANDWGLRTELTKYYPSGFQVYAWYTHTNAKDYVNGHRYQDKGVGISVPLDLFSTTCVRNRWSYSMSAWLRDIGVVAGNGSALYPTIREYREKLIQY